MMTNPLKFDVNKGLYPLAHVSGTREWHQHALCGRGSWGEPVGLSADRLTILTRTWLSRLWSGSRS